MKYLILLLFSTSVFASTGGIYTTHVTYPDDPNFPTKDECDNPGSRTLVITSAAHLRANINSSSYDNFCLPPGGYDWGNAHADRVNQSGTALQRRYLVYYNTNETYEKHPYHQTPAERAIITGIRFKNSVEYWTVDRLTIDGNDADAPVQIQGDGEPNQGGHNIILNRMYIHSGTGGAGMVAGGGDYNLVQGSFIGDSGVTLDTDDHCLVHRGEDMKVNNNEFRNCAGNNVQKIATDAEGGEFNGNEAYGDENFYVNCNSDPPVFNTSGLCNCMETNLAFKGGGVAPFPFEGDDLMHAKENFLWGMNRGNNGACSGGGTGTVGVSVLYLETGYGVDFADNVVWPGENNIESQAITSTGARKDYWTIRNNFIADFDRGISLPSAQTQLNDIHYNTWKDVGQWHFGGEANNDWIGNLLINVPDEGTLTVGGGSVFDYNAYANSERDTVAGNNDTVIATEAATNNETFCVMRYRISNPSEKCWDYASTTSTSPHASTVDGASLSTGRGVDNEDKLTRDSAGFIAPYLEYTLEYEESPDGTFKFVAPVDGSYRFRFKGIAPDTSSNELDFEVDSVPSGQTVEFDVSAVNTWKQGVSMTLTAGIHTLDVTLTEPVDLDKIMVTNNPTYPTIEPDNETPLPPSGMEMMQMGEKEKNIEVAHVHNFGCLVDRIKVIFEMDVN